MKEDLLQYIWKFQYFNQQNLQGTKEEEIQVISPGVQNSNQGPDFTHARLKINKVIWVGQVELHIKSSHWHVHHHSSDDNYDRIILHVVYHHDMEILDQNGNQLVTLELQPRISNLLLERYRALMNKSQFIPCEKIITPLNKLVLQHWKSRLVAERLLSRSNDIVKELVNTHEHWEEVFWRMLAHNLGLKVNADQFYKIAKSLPVTLLAKHKSNVIQLEALLLGQAGLLEKNFEEKYPLLLQKEYRFYKVKYKLIPITEEMYFLRMRPANFPSLRLAQLAMLIHKSEHLFSKIREAESLQQIKKYFEVVANDYWHYHYCLDEISGFKEKKLGSKMIDSILINTVIPILFTYGLHHQIESFKEKAIQWLEKISAEKNAITNGFLNLGFSNKDAMDSQFLIQLKNEYCNQKLCLQCSIGNALLKK